MPVGTPRLQAVPRKWELLTMVERRNAARVHDRTPATSSRIRKMPAWMPVLVKAGPIPAPCMPARSGPL